MLRLPSLAVLLVFVGCLAPEIIPADAGPTAPPFVVEPAPVWDIEGTRIATFNGEFLFDGEGDEGAATFPWKGDPAKARAHRAAVGAVIRQLDADVILVPESENLRALELLIAEALPDLGYTPTLVDGRDTFTGQDVGILSRIPIESAGRTEERASVGVSDATYGVSKNVWARLTLAGRPTTLVGVHFLARPDDRARRDRREAQAEVIRRLVARESAAGREVVVLGDLNDFDESTLDRAGSVPITDVLALIKEAGPGPDDDLINVLADVPQSKRFTAFYDRNRNDQFDPGEFSAIDHVLLSPGLYRQVRDVRFVHTHDPREVSDHFPIVVTLAD